MYESAADLRNERTIIDVLVERWNFDHAFKNSIAYGIDWSLLRERLVRAFAECKERNLPFNYGDGYYLAVQKVVAGRRLSALCKVPCFLIVRFDDGVIRWCDLKPRDNPVTIIFGRTDRNDPADQEPCIVYPWEDWSEL